MKKALILVGVSLVSKIAASSAFLSDKEEDLNSYVDNIQNEVITHSLDGYGPDNKGPRRRSRSRDIKYRDQIKVEAVNPAVVPVVAPVVGPLPVPVLVPSPEPKIPGPVPKDECKPEEPQRKPVECDECDPVKPIKRHPDGHSDDLDLTRTYVPLHVSHKKDLENKDFRQGITDDFRDGRIKFPDFASSASEDVSAKEEKKESFVKNVNVKGDFKNTNSDSKSYKENETKNKNWNKEKAKARKEVDEIKNSKACDKNFNQKLNKKYKDNNHNVGVLSSTEKCSEREHAETLQLNGSKKILENVDLFEETNECEQIVRDQKKGERSSKQVWRKRRENKNNINEDTGSHKQGRCHILKNAGKNQNANKKCKLSKDSGHEAEANANNNVKIRSRRYDDVDSKYNDNEAKSDFNAENKSFDSQNNSQVDGSFSDKKQFEAESEYSRDKDISRDYYVKRD